MRKLTDSEIQAAFASINDETPIYCAIMQIIDASIENATAQVSHEDLATNHGALAHCAGGLAWLRDLRDLNRSLYADAHPMI